MEDGLGKTAYIRLYRIDPKGVTPEVLPLTGLRFLLEGLPPNGYFNTEASRRDSG
jgi:hypothetical protein